MNKRIITYSLLAHLNNSVTSQSNFDQIFIPIVKRGLSKMCTQGIYSGNDLREIKVHLEELYGLDMPESILSTILEKIQNELNTVEKKVVTFYNDGSFVIEEFVFDEFEEEVEKKENDLNNLEKLFYEFATVEGKLVKVDTLFEFIEAHKISLGKYIGKKYPREHKDNTLEARFVNFVNHIPALYITLQSIYIGSIISTYLEYRPTIVKSNVELILDTNFIISLIDLNTPSSTSNCRRLLEVAGKMGYRFSVLDITVEETDRLLKAKIDNFDIAFLSRQLDPEDIYNACDRRKISKTDLEKIRTDIVATLEEFNVILVSHTEKYRNKAKFSEEYEKLKEKRSSPFAALHDATCMEYVMGKRGKKVYEFVKVNCWFVNNSSSQGRFYTNGAQPFYIKAEELLNLLWLASPAVKSVISVTDMASIGLSRLVSATLDDSLPSSITIRKLDENIRKYAKEKISDEDVIRVSKSLAERTFVNLEGLNNLAQQDSVQFVSELQEIANKQQQHENSVKAMMERIFEEVEKKRINLKKQTSLIHQEREGFAQSLQQHEENYRDVVDTNSEIITQFRRLKQENINLENSIRKPRREKYIRNKILYWRLRALGWIVLSILIMAMIIFCVYYQNNWDGILAKKAFMNQLDNLGVSWVLYIGAAIFIGVIVKLLSDRFNQSSVNAFKANLNIPEEFLDKRIDD